MIDHSSMSKSTIFAGIFFLNLNIWNLLSFNLLSKVYYYIKNIRGQTHIMIYSKDFVTDIQWEYYTLKYDKWSLKLIVV